ncbi:MAG: DUF3494 domain-containing protein [bacterium]|nr:DUF3494 domain-containing protein [bacterium]
MKLHSSAAPARLLLASVLLSAVSTAQVGQSTLWASDDVTRTIYHVTQDGVVLFFFEAGVVSSLAVDPGDDTLWAAKEGFSRIVHYDRLGNQLGFFETTDYDAGATRPEGVAVDYFDGTLWVVDDVTSTVYNVETDGTLIGSFTTATFDPLATSPQGIAGDPQDGTLWLTDNLTDAVYHVTATGALIDWFPADVFAQAANNPQGISVDEINGTLWVTDRVTQTVYNLERDGTEIHSFASAHYGSNNPTGIAYDRSAGPLDLGQAADFGILGCGLVSIRHADTLIEGDVALAPGGRQNFFHGLIEGSMFVDPNADDTKLNSVQISGTVLARELGPAMQDARMASDTAASVTPTQSFGNVNTSQTITGTDGFNVIDIERVSLRFGEKLTLSGTSASRFLLNVHGRFRLSSGSELVLEGGVLPENVLVNVIDNGGIVRITGHSTLRGTLLTPHRRIRVGRSVVEGALISGWNIRIWGASTIRYAN